MYSIYEVRPETKCTQVVQVSEKFIQKTYMDSFVHIVVSILMQAGEKHLYVSSKNSSSFIHFSTPLANLQRHSPW